MIVAAYFTGSIDRIFGLILTGLLLYYVCYSYQSDKKNQEEQGINIEQKQHINIWLSLIQALFGIVLTVLGAKFLVSSASTLARNWGITEQVIGLTIVAVGTSLPELITSIMSAIHKENAVSFGNVVGSNIFNALFVLGMTAVILPVPVSKTMGLDIDLMTIVTAILIGIAFWKKGVSRAIGGFFILSYALYVYLMFC
jgi:cation:H+ antiporter